MLNVDIFVIPNCPDTFGSFKNKSKYTDKLGEISDHELMVELWYTSPSIDNWRSGAYKDPKTGGAISSFVPVSWIRGMREGDTRIWEMSGKLFKVTASQMKYRYPFGGFGEVAGRLVKQSEKWAKEGTTPYVSSEA